MKQNVGFSAVIIAIIALAIRSGAPPAGRLDSLSPGLGRNAPESTALATEMPMLDGPWLATRSFFQAADKPEAPDEPGSPTKDAKIDFETPASVQRCVAAAPGACGTQIAKYFGISVPNHIQFLIATVPDPLHSRLALFTDSAIQAIAKAADNSGWIFATQWLPWIDGPNPEEKDPDKRREQRQTARRQEKQPGILVFRRGAPYGDDVLLIFVVGETPTAGMNPAQFQLARAYMRAIHEPDDEVRLQGPTFSGSFYSLTELLKEDRRQAVGLASGAVGGVSGAVGGGSGGGAPVVVPGAAAKKYRVRSGTVTSAADGQELLDLGVDFRGATANTIDRDRYFKSALGDLGIEPEQAAVLIEDESAYGAAEAASAAADKRIRVFRFPRDISHLRNAYREAVAASKAGNNPAPDIEFSIKDPETGEDSIPVFSGSQSPLSQNGVVNSIANAIRREGILLVRVDATNVLDMLFLASALKRQCPDTRLMLTFADVLLVQAAQSDPLAGTLVLASYPTFFASNEWMGGHQSNEPFTFSDANSESVYNATVLLLNNDSDPLQILADYHWGEINHPPTWLLTLDHQGFLPVNAYPHKKEDEESESWFQPVSPVDATTTRLPAERTWPALPAPPRSWNLVSTLLALGGLGLSLWIWWISGNPSRDMDDRFSLLQINSEGIWRRFHLFALLLVLLLMEVTLWIPSLRSAEPSAIMWLLVVICLAGPLGALIGAWRVIEQLKPGSYAKLEAWSGVAGANICVLLWLYSCFIGGDRSLFFAFRALEFRFGSSPTWPVLTALGAVGLFAFVQLTRFYLAACQKPTVATNGLGDILKDRLHRAWEDFNDELRSCFGFRLTSRMRLMPKAVLYTVAGAVSVVVLLGALFRLDRQMRSIDGNAYNVLAMALQLLVVGLLLLTCVHIRLLWRSLRSFLEILSMLPLARFFRPIDGAGAGRPIWVRRLHLESIDIHIQALYLLHDMTVLAPRIPTPDAAQFQYFGVLKGMTDGYGLLTGELLKADGERTREETLHLTNGVRSTNELIAKETQEFLRSHWRAKLLDGPWSPAIPAAAGESPAKQPEANPLDQFAELAQKFVALHYTAFILYAVRQIQNLLVFLSTGFVLLMISLSCYSLQAPQLVERGLLVVFLILGAITLSCLVGMEKNAVLSHISGSPAGKLDAGSYVKIASYGALPLLSLMASMFPSISNFVLSWVEPTLEAFK